MTEPHKFTLDEMETTFTIDATDRSKVRAYSNDPIFIARLEKIGAVPYREASDGGMFYDMHSDQLLLRKGKPKRGPLSKAQLEALASGRKESD